MRYLIAALVLLPVLASAQETRTATITFARPTQYTDGSPIPAGVAITYRLYQGAKGGTKTLAGTITGTTATVNSGLAPGETCWEVTAVANGVESARSNEGCKTFAYPATQAVTITVN